MKVLVTGGAGFIGSHLVDRLIQEKNKVFCLDDLSGGKLSHVNKKAKFFKCDLRNSQQTAKLIEKIKPELIYHLAACAAENKAQFSPIDITSRNWNTFINTLVPALRCSLKKIVVTSSIAVYGAIQTPFKEIDDPEPEDLYGVSKLMMEKSLPILAKIHHFEYVIARPHNVYGPRQNMQDPYRNVVTIFMNALLEKKPYYIYGDGNQRRCFSYIDDVVAALHKCGFLQVSGMTFNIGADKDYTLNKLSEIIQDVSGIKIPPIYLDERPQEVQNAIPDHTLAKNILGYKDKTTLLNGIKKTWGYAKKLGYQRPKFTKVEIDSSLLPKNWRTR